MNERDLQKAITQYLELRQIVFWRNYVGPVIRHDGVMTKNPMAGLPDIIGILSQGRMLAIEIKSSRGKLSDRQKIWRDKIERAGAIYVLAYELQDVINALA